MDEKGFLIVVLKKTRRIININTLRQGKLMGAGQDGNRGWITFIGSICCDGTYLPAGLIFKGQGGLQDQWVDAFDTDQEIAYFASTPTGWSNEEIAFKWLTTTFDRATRAKASNGLAWRLLWVDGHNSHINMRFLNWCHDNRVFVVMYPSHSTHRLQPLYVSCFSPLAIRYSQQLDQWIAKYGGIIPLNQSDFYAMFKVALKEAFTENNIASGWQKTGLYPFNPEIVLAQLDRPQSPPRSPTQSEPHSLQPLYEQPQWRKMRRVLAQAKNKNPLNQVILQGFETLSAQNVLLQAEIEGLKATISLQKRRAVRSRNLFEKLQDEDGNKAIWFSPKKIARARELQQEKDETEDQAQREKEEKAKQRALLKEKKELELQQRREQREKARKERERLKEVKEAKKKEAKQQREANQRRKSEAVEVRKNKKGQSEARRSIATAGALHKEENEETEVQTVRTRIGRKTRAPKHFEYK